jgi:hypothetical protein
MNRSTFIASTAAVVAAAAVPMASPAAVPEAAAAPIVYGARKLFAINGGPPWVVAESAEAALAYVTSDENFDVEPTATVRMLEPGEGFTMTYEDAPEDNDCDCDRAECTDEDGEFECECGGLYNRTLYAAEWAENRLDGAMMVGEYDGW